eukprot:CAMPEP_0113571676 /NCGR_PEP_ID=MMETSP0015_2-20120614/25683_1 /TAXON_ID=2838 /ORGANISM="Odontella" /LENGTH=354 /DNA_ID=CAMNT_0000474647 /DNA_START=166 /DNA_END=1230 /DNA_ORIENTATION=- /assembly_acc=CAM_ASM_000160
MNGTPTGGGTTTGLGGGAYSFYLNVVVLNQTLAAAVTSTSSIDEDGPADESGGGGGKNEDKKEKEAPPQAAAPQTNLAPAAAREEAEDSAVPPSDSAEEEAGGIHVEEEGDGGAPPRKSLLDSMPASLKSLSFGTSASERSASGSGGGLTLGEKMSGLSMKDLYQKKGTALDKSLHNTMKAVSNRTAALSDKAGRYVAGKTMIARASSALDKALPEVMMSLSQSGAGGGSKLDLNVGRRFQQGPVIVLQVDLRAAGLPAYVEAVRGEDAAEHYRCALSSLRLLGAKSAAAELEREMLPLIRKGLMERAGEEVVRLMKVKNESDLPLELECIALEEGEEARWLFTYMEFQSQMKQ